jgi:hypothetical protein
MTEAELAAIRVLNTKASGAPSAYAELAAMEKLVPGALFHPLTVDLIAMARTQEQPVLPMVVVAQADNRYQPRPRSAPPPSLRLEALPLREVERRLGIHRSRLAAHLRAGTIRGVMFGNRTRVPLAEIERILRDGLPPLPEKGIKTRRRRRMSRPNGGTAAAIRALEI